VVLEALAIPPATGKRDDARALVREACDRIAEGADTGDVRDARALQERLGG
jgi:hypothetical protein